MSYQPDTPFDNIESSHEYVKLLAEAVGATLAEIEGNIAAADGDVDERRKAALQLVAFKLKKLSSHMTASRRILNDLRSLRRLMYEERATSPNVGRAKQAIPEDNSL